MDVHSSAIFLCPILHFNVLEHFKRDCQTAKKESMSVLPSSFVLQLRERDFKKKNLFALVLLHLKDLKHSSKLENDDS